MDIFYLGVLCFLFILAIFDLSVGVANDAVNFLSPAVGAKSAKFKTILLVAAIGIFVGASTSSGMMDIARHGILNPTQYAFDDVMCIFLSVAATDVILLDIFNTLGMPTSTTVSMVFGLLGGSSALAMSKILQGGVTYAELINTDKALSVIIGIFLSVAVAFVFGFIVMWLSRLIFTFNYKKHLRWSIALFGGISITSIFYFLLVSGLKGSRLLVSIGWTPQWIEANNLLILGSCLAVFTLLMEILHLFRVNIFRIIVLFGTFSLAMAFAGNDLVNFIGTPLAGLESYLDFTANGNGMSADYYKMDVLAGESHLPGKQWFLIAAGVIMTVAICTSKKAQKVVETTVNLSRQDDGEEVFSSSKIARKTVRSVLNTTSVISKYVPVSIKNWVDMRFNSEDAVLDEGVAFDQVRASVNLVLAGLLIVVGTALQLPLSTTYVAFMVAMGSSLADRAWGRETAVYRITGVITVIGGWFITAGAAFIMSFIIATLNHLGGIVSMLFVIGVLAFVLINNNRKFKKKQETETVDTLFRKLVRSHDKQEVWAMLVQHVRETQGSMIAFSRAAYRDITGGLMYENIKSLRQASNSIESQKSMWKRYRRKEILGMRKIDYLQAVEKNTWFHLGCNNCSQIIYCLKRMLEPCVEHVDNNFSPLPQNYVEEFIPICNEVDRLFDNVERMIVSGDFTGADEVLVEGNALKSRISQVRHQQQDRIQREDSNIKISLLYLNTLQETQELISMVRHLLRASKRFQS
ncbi:inorganic phosphate transporter [Bacteroides acidifaciens]|uniref:inorganic phosphate transporter n=1 Tax=Bacteroides acidifaciens TaxID=85831 RepID=UPI00271454ED|nr:inorganic phosphate transporter [Bacteroides acidifaciens]HRF86191.1 inorganic phosphate transporter [Alloprevotella sp.]